MTKFFDKVGYGHDLEKGHGIHSLEITERPYYGDVVRPSRRLGNGEKVNDDVTVGNAISILADSYATENIDAIRFVWWNGVRWKVTYVENQRPRLILTLGGVYNGPKVAVPGPP